MIETRDRLLVHRLAIGLSIGVCLVLTACSAGSAASPQQTATSTATASAGTAGPTGQGRGFLGERGADSGTLTRVDGSVLTVSTDNGTVTVNISANTTVERVVSGTLADLQTGQFLSVTGSADPSGLFVASSITVRTRPEAMPTPQPGTGFGPSDGRFSPPSGTRTPARPTDRPTANGIFGTIAAINGNSVTLSTLQDQQTVVLVSQDTAINKMASGSASDLRVGQSLTITGRPNDQGGVDAFVITITH